ncbi:glycosyltransferase [Nonlabens spongiae]|uniref:Glycosyltransferase n=1 Tax=Nonlabens spongiae TaxID=331648 RepID=A0A1W6MGD5_9FLAO|nr:glycosyltransferase family 4 protein [Nonlabens spongiae]ARN76539.1 glycosyltransferase [Nonlabens spongiae]
MTITLVLPQPPAYSETFFRSKISGLQESGYKVILVTGSSEQKFTECLHLQHPRVSQNAFVQILKMGYTFIGLLSHLARIIKYIKLEKSNGTSMGRILEKIYLNSTLLKLDTDWLHYGFATMAMDRELVGKSIGAKVAVSFRGYDIDVFPLNKDDVYGKLWHNLDRVHSISNYLIEKAYELGLPQDITSEVITPAVDIDNLPKCTESSRQRSKKLKIITIARLHWIKGIDDLIEVAQLLKQKSIDFEWIIVGDGDKKHLERYKYRLYEKGLQGEVKLLGKRSHAETLKILCDCSIYVQTSLSEGFCNAVLEAQAMGKLCIVTDGGALIENVENGKSGWVVPKLDPESMRDKIIEVSSLSSIETNEISNYARLRVKRLFTLENQKRQFNRFYNS